MRTLQSFFDQDPPEHFVRESPKNPNGKFLPYEYVERFLNEDMDIWSTRNIKVSLPFQMSGQAGKSFFNVTLELFGKKYYYIDLEDFGTIEFCFVGAATFTPSDFPIKEGEDSNNHIAATGKSLAIMNAAQDIGKKFGRDLNLRYPDYPKEAVASALKHTAMEGEFGMDKALKKMVSAIDKSKK